MSLLYSFTGHSDLMFQGRLLVRNPSWERRNDYRFIVAHESVDPIAFEVILPRNYSISRTELKSS